MESSSQDPVVSDREILELMEAYGGGFVKALAFAWRKADSTNRAKIKATWPNYWQEYGDFKVILDRIRGNDPNDPNNPPSS